MQKILILFLSLIFPLTALSEHKAIGVSTKPDPTIYLAFDLTETIRIEPSIYYRKFKREYAFDEYEVEYYEIAFGLFNRAKFSDKSAFYYGARLGYIFDKYDEEKEEGHKISPSLGLEYYILDNLTLSGEVMLNYYDTSSASSDFKETRTASDISVRFYF